MSARKTAALVTSLFLAATLANAASRKNTIEIKVLNSDTRSTGSDNNGVAKNCDQVTFDAYCRSTSPVTLVHTLVVQEGNNPPFRISCTSTSRFSRCVPLPQGGSFEARRDKHGIVVYYIDDNGKARSQLYTLVAADAKATVPATAPPVASAPSAAPVAAQPAPASAENAGQSPAPAVVPSAAASPPATVKCSFSSTPAGAEVTLDGRYVGSTPSVVGVAVGDHVVVMTMAGFVQWKRDLSVSSGSELTVNAVLQKAQ